MGSLLLVIFAATCAAISNLFFRMNTQNSSSTSVGGYLVVFYFFSFIASLIFSTNLWNTELNMTVLILGGTVGLLNVFLMKLTARALEKGPAGLTFAFQNGSAVFPGVLLFLMFGSSFGFTCSFLQIVGLMLVLYGLFLGTQGQQKHDKKPSLHWLKYVFACFAVQVCALTLIQGRCILFDCAKLGEFFVSLQVTETNDGWFMPGQFGVAFLLQLIMFLSEKRKLQLKEMGFGCMAGGMNFASTLLLLLATKYAQPFEKSILFPLFASATIILCNTWANRLYQERFNLRANACCSLGVFMGVFF